MKKIILILSIFFVTVANAQSWDNLTFDNNITGLHTNPLRGLIPPDYVNTRNFPYSMEFFYIPLRGTMLSMNSFDWSLFESKLETVANRGNTAVFRFFLDYPGNPIATPQFLIDSGIVMNSYTEYQGANGQSKSPDYNDSRTMAALVKFIDTLGKKYNGDPRISIVQAGLVGFWGEWHTFPYSFNMNDANRRIILEKFIASFPNTKLNFRGVVPNTPVNTLLNVGYHDDSFMLSTLGSVNWYFWPRLTAAGVTNFWQNHPMGGEIHPDVQSSTFAAIPNVSPAGQNYQDFETCINTTHASYLYNFEIWQHAVGSTKYNNALIQNKKLGYKFYVNGVKLNSYQAGIINFDVRIENRGIAPFYYNWNVELALLKNNVLTSLGTTNWNINAIQPTNEVVKNFTVNQALTSGSYTILMRFVNPLTAVKSNAKQLSFANTTQNADRNGWLSLKSFVVTTTLPLRLISFNASENNCAGSLAWKTADETNVRNIEVEQSLDGITFSKITTVLAGGNAIENKYNVTVTPQSGTTYYRLKMVDKDDKYSYSNIVSLKSNCQDKDFIAIYPNPILNADLAVLSFKTAYSGKAIAKVFGAAGQQIAAIPVVINAGLNSVPIATKNMLAGVYYISLMTNTGTTIGNTIKMVKE